MSILVWLEQTALAEYILISAWGYPIMIMLHSLGLAIMVGLSTILSLRILGFFQSIPFASLPLLLKVAWIGFVINFLSGGALFASQATMYIVDPVFLIKMFFVIVAAILVALMQSSIKKAPAAAEGSFDVASNKDKIFAACVLVAWTFGMVTGRLIAYL